MNTDSKSVAVSRLSHLADDLEAAYPKVGDRIAEKVAAVDAAISKIGVTLRYRHYAEDKREALAEGGTSAYSGPFVLAHESTADGQVEFMLCAARGRDRKCGLYVSACTYTEHDEEFEDRDGVMRSEPAVQIVSVDLLRPAEVPLPVRVKILGVLDKFVEAYEKHVREDRKSLLKGSTGK